MRLVNHHYDMSKINIAFFLGGLLLVGTWVWAIYDDYEKPYKEYQRTYYEVYENQLRLAKKDEWTDQKRQKKRELEQELSETRQKLEARGGEIDQLEKKLEKKRQIELKKADAKVKSVNSKLKPVEYRYQQELVEAKEGHGEVPESLQKRFKELKQKYEKAVERRARIQEEIENIEQEIERKRSRISELEKEIRDLTREVQVLKDTLKRVSDRPINQILDAPIINFIRPRVEIKQFQAKGMKQNYNFDLVSRRDYCKSCHMGIDNPAFKLDEDGEFANEHTAQAFKEVFPNEKKRKRYKEVFKAHPRMDLIGPTSSKYPFKEYGCTGCHMGDGRALEFTRAAHTPDSKKERKQWKKRYDWHLRHYWEEPMLKSQYLEASFYQFFPSGTRVHVPDAPKLNEGRQAFRKYGCNNCHAVEGMNYQRKIGFSLEHIGSKLEPDWVRRWVEKPTDFDPTTAMPQVFHRVNISGPEDRERSTVVIDAITTYLFEQSKPIQLTPPPPVRGDAENGKRLVQETGCVGCHSMVEEGIDYNKQAPDLSNIGEKVNRKWLYNWLRNPEKIWPETHMPSMKLTREEANDITEYLMSRKHDDWSADNFPNELVTDKSLDEVVDQRLESLAKKFAGQTRGPQATERKVEEIKQSATGMSDERALKLYVGEQSVEHFGCASCHAIPGHEGKNRIGAELTTWANKSIHKLAFNFIHIPHTRQDYVNTKLNHTGIFDRGLQKSYLEKYRMPKPNLTDEEREKVVTFVMSLRDRERVGEEVTKHASPAQKMAYEGNKLINSYNCQGCHTLNEESAMGDFLVDYYQKQLEKGKSYRLGKNTNPSARDMAQAHVPPSLTNVGLRLTEDWMFSFLKNPVGPNGRDRIRTWQHVRMPNFQFTDEEASDISQGLVYEGWDRMPPKVSPGTRKAAPESIRVGKAIFNRVCSNCHVAEGNDLYKAPQMTPNLNYIRNKFHHEGFLDWIEKPAERFVPENTRLYRHQGMIPYSQVPMTKSFLGFEPEGDYSTKKKQMQALRDYLFYGTE